MLKVTNIKIFKRLLKKNSAPKKGILESMREQWKLLGSMVLAGIYIITLIAAAIIIGDSPVNRCINISLLVAGLCTGGLIGTVISPYTKKEGEEFSAYTKALTAFISGYVISKIDKTVEVIFAKDLLLTPLPGFRVISFVTAVLISMHLTFILRRYG